MAIEFHCTQCGQMLRVADSSAGKGARCPGCKTVMVVPAAGDLASRSLPPLNQPAISQPVAPAAPPPAPQQPAAPGQDDLFAYLKQAVTPNAPPPAAYQQPGAYQQPAAAPFADKPANPFGDQAAASANPYASPAPVAYSAYPSQPGELGLPWETKPPGLGVWWETSQMCLSDAESAFRRMRQYGGIGSPMLYAVFGLLLGFVGQTAWSLPAMMFEAFAGPAANPAGGQVAGMEVMVQLLLNGLITVVWATGGLLISAGVTHLCLMLVGGAHQGYETTYRVTAFTAGSIAWLSVVPCFGPLIALVMTLICQIQGLAQAHETTAGRAAAAVLLPVAFCLVVVVAGFIAAVAVIANL
ncbi:MAG TPA: YIP1 family protein [Pirellulaceae bacterium]|nr:YIP1 family protein [Pirellulaceae bacterium]